MSETTHSPEYYAELDKMELFADDTVLKIVRGETAGLVSAYGSKSLRSDEGYAQGVVEEKLQPFFAELFQILPTATVVETTGDPVLFFKEFLTGAEERKCYMVSVVMEDGACKLVNIEPNLAATDAVS